MQPYHETHHTAFTLYILIEKYQSLSHFLSWLHNQPIMQYSKTSLLLDCGGSE